MNSRYYRERARMMLSGKWVMAILVTLVAGILGGLLGSGTFSITLKGEAQDWLPDSVLIYLAIVGSIGSALGTIQFIIGGTVQLGYCKYLLKLHDNEVGEERPGIRDLFSQFGRFADGFVLSLLTGIYIFLWTLLFIIPGIVAAYKYVMAPFILLENPDMKPKDALAASKELMYGHKWELFVLEWSFIGWLLLSALTLGIGNLWLTPYMNAARAAFYRDLRPALTTPESPAEIPAPIIYTAETPAEE